MMGLYHLGHLLALLETGMLPSIISGTSAGSVIGAILCTRTEEELKHDLQPDVLAERLICFCRPWLERIKSVWKTGHLFGQDEWMDLIQWFTCGDLTFEEAYRKSGRVFCITLSSTTKKAPSVLLNYLTAPNVTIASAVVASAAVPGFVPPMQLQYKQPDGTITTSSCNAEELYFDGSIQSDIPVSGLAEMLNCQFFIVCQANVSSWIPQRFGLTLVASHTLFHFSLGTRVPLVAQAAGPVENKNPLGVEGSCFRLSKCSSRTT